jgi:phosphocarrier protein
MNRKSPVVESEVTVVNPFGLDERPAALVVRTMERYPDCVVQLQKGDLVINAASMMGVMMLAACRGTRLQIHAEGPSAAEAVDELVALVGGTNLILSDLERELKHFYVDKEYRGTVALVDALCSAYGKEFHHLRSRLSVDAVVDRLAFKLKMIRHRPEVYDKLIGLGGRSESYVSVRSTLHLCDLNDFVQELTTRLNQIDDDSGVARTLQSAPQQ